MERARPSIRLRLHHSHQGSRERMISDFNRSIENIRGAGFSKDEEDSRIRKIEGAFHMTAPTERTTTSPITIVEAGRRILPKARTIFHRH